jgi:hypothetical protein
MKLEDYSAAALKRRRGEGWTCGAYAAGDEPTGLLLMAGKARQEGAATVLWGVKEGDEDWQETILCTQPDRIEAVKEIAKRDGWGRFRVAVVDLTTPPDFSKAVKA